MASEFTIAASVNSPEATDRDGESGPAKKLSEAALRALAEAEARRREVHPPPPREINGRGGLEPIRYGDWETRGLASDF